MEFEELASFDINDIGVTIQKGWFQKDLEVKQIIN
jgi:hypothetical protein